MRLDSFLLVIASLASYVQAGNPLWEISPATSMASHGSASKRAVSIVPSDDPHDNAGVRRWPKKTLTYAFSTADAEKKLGRILEEAKKLWNQLSVEGFQYEKLELKKCQGRRSECMIIYYNNDGKLLTSVGLQPLDDTFDGPYMHLSDKNDVGNLNPVVNVAHELGHAWGLWHEHQARKWWGQSGIDEFWGGTLNGETFMTADYHPERLKDYESALEKLAEAKGLKSPEELTQEQIDFLIRDQETAKNYGFTAVEWMPLKPAGMEADEIFDRNSLMLYPSGAGGKGEVVFDDDGNVVEDKRLSILTYPDGERMPVKKMPTGEDVARLLKIYGGNYRGVSRLHNDKGSRFKGLIKKMRSSLSLKAGDTEKDRCE
ncbi:zinc-dependent metalloprotease [Fusarium mexicanum]|uniref:Zinc-dependent metalloprotease n=1 Tax=Fusarium mexicanum TaxID=751941 RepID=A0A8H5J9A3_9HYPO|nr:zinc-dependent metalloprotease [Fusarium mexicanum]